MPRLLAESLEEFKAHIAVRLDAHFARFAPVIAAINAGFAATSNLSRVSPPAPSSSSTTKR